MHGLLEQQMASIFDDDEASSNSEEENASDSDDDGDGDDDDECEEDYPLVWSDGGVSVPLQAALPLPSSSASSSTAFQPLVEDRPVRALPSSPPRESESPAMEMHGLDANSLLLEWCLFPTLPRSFSSLLLSND